MFQGDDTAESPHGGGPQVGGLTVDGDRPPGQAPQRCREPRVPQRLDQGECRFQCHGPALRPGAGGEGQRGDHTVRRWGFREYPAVFGAVGRLGDRQMYDLRPEL